MTFRDLGLIEPIARAVATQGYDAPTPIQTKSIPAIIAGRDVLGCAQTGTGKTAAFTLPILHRLTQADLASMAKAASPHRTKGRTHVLPRALVLCPTRELATQILESVRTYGKHLPLKATAIFGGVNQHSQVRDLKHGVDLLVATPGRLLDLMQQGHVDLSAIEVLVLDEADRMLDMGFIRDIRRIVERLRNDRQTLLFSATMPSEIRSLADSILCNPVFVQAAALATPVEAIAQSVYHVARQHKAALLERLLRGDGVERTLVFTRTKHGADKLVRTLQRVGIDAHAIHGNKSQNARTRAMNGFKSGRSPVLVATDIASRGIDVDDVTHVFNYDMPNAPETYVHRIGRTARAGASGTAVSLCAQEELGELRAIERLIGKRLAIAAGEGDLTEVVTRTHTIAHEARTAGGQRSRQQRRHGAVQLKQARRAVAPVADNRPKSSGATQSHRSPRGRSRPGRGRLASR